MPSNTEITVSQLSRLVGLPDAPVVVDVRTDADVDADPRMLPGSIRRPAADVAAWLDDIAAHRIVVVCRHGQTLSQGVAAWLRANGTSAETLEGGHDAWVTAGGLLWRAAALPSAGRSGGSVWVTRARPKIDRVACPWLIRRFVDPQARFLFVAPGEVVAVAERFGAMPFDVEGVFWSHRGEGCTFDTMLAEFGLASAPLDRLAAIVRAADTDRLDLVPQAAGVLAISLGLSRMYRDDLAQLQAGTMLYDALYRWCRDAVAETHTWDVAGADTTKGAR